MRHLHKCGRLDDRQPRYCKSIRQYVGSVDWVKVTMTGHDPLEQSLETPLGRYRLLALLGQGGMADVYLASAHGPGGFQKLLVVKLARFSGDAMFSAMFLDEARLAAQLSHPHIVHTYEVGEEASR